LVFNFDWHYYYFWLLSISWITQWRLTKWNWRITFWLRNFTL